MCFLKKTGNLCQLQFWVNCEFCELTQIDLQKAKTKKPAPKKTEPKKEEKKEKKEDREEKKANEQMFVIFFSGCSKNEKNLNPDIF